MKLNGANILCKSIESLGITHLFSLPGTKNISLYNALKDSKLRTVIPTHELAATFMAIGFYNASGNVAAVSVIPGPGFTYALTGLAEAKLDSAALLFIVIAPNQKRGFEFQHQAIDQENIVKPLVKAIVKIETAAQITEYLAEAYNLATKGEPGPVYVEIREEVLNEITFFSEARASSKKETPDIAEIARAIKGSRRPILFCGAGTQSFSEELFSLAKSINAPVLTTTSGRGVIPESDPLSLYYDYSFGGGKELNKVIAEADCILALGCKFSSNSTGGFTLQIPHEKLLHIDASKEVLGTNYPAKVVLHADLKDLLTPLKNELSTYRSVWKQEEILNFRKLLRDEQLQHLNPEPTANTGKISDFFSNSLFQTARIVTDSGYHQALTRYFHQVNIARGLIVPTDFQSMGFGLPAAIGAALADPKRHTVLIIGDGGFLMSGIELVTAIKEKIELTVFIFNDNSYGLIELEQKAAFGESFGTTLASVDYQKFLVALGATDNSTVSVIEIPIVKYPRAKPLLNTVAKKLLSAQQLSWLKKALGRR